ncbi:MAG: RNA polymerase sigma factor [Oscillospiraceae bacterium]|nr:RNA polymerase sigma factor [Oscillospiraceae bacterium]
MDNGASSYRRFLDGDENGMVEIIRDYKDGLMLYLNSFTRNIYTAEELMEETFVRLVVKRPKFSEKYSFKTWLYTIGRNVAVDCSRRNSRTVSLSHEEMQSMLDEEKSLEQAYIQNEEKIAVHQAMKKLKTEYRQVLYLTFFEELDNAQTAAVMKKSRRQIENLIYRAKSSLKKELEKEGFVYEGL